MELRNRSGSFARTRSNISFAPDAWDPEHMLPLKLWLESLLATELPPAEELLTGKPFEDGQLLFRIARTLAPDFRMNVKMSTSHLPFLAGNNVDFFLDFLHELKIPQVLSLSI